MRSDELYLADALQALRELREYQARRTKEQFLAAPMEQSFVFHQLVILGEASVRLRPSYESRYPEVPWAKLAGLRNRLVHAYFDLDLALLWSFLPEGLEELAGQYLRILQTEFPEGQG